MHFYIDKKDFTKNYGLFTAIGIIVASIALCYILFHNPYKKIHQQIFEIAARTTNYYRERPGYWNLSTDSAREDGLIKEAENGLNEYDITIGQGVDGNLSMPSSQSFDVALKHLSKSACISLLEQELSAEQKLSLIQITVINSDGQTDFSWGSEHKLPIERYTSRDVCAIKENTLMWTFQ